MLRFEVLDDPVVTSVPVAPGVVTWPVPVDDFALHGVRLDDEVPRVRLAPPGPRVVLCVRGELAVANGDGEVPLGAGQAAIGAAAGGPVTLTGAGEAYVASVGRLTVRHARTDRGAVSVDAGWCPDRTRFGHNPKNADWLDRP